jgi:hypothetical protein
VFESGFSDDKSDLDVVDAEVLAVPGDNILRVNVARERRVGVLVVVKDEAIWRMLAVDDGLQDCLGQGLELDLLAVMPEAAVAEPSVGSRKENELDGTRARPFLTIQKGVDAANEFDQLVLLPGTYAGLGNRGLRHHGKKIQLKSLTQAVLETIIDCQHAPDGFILNNNKDSDSPFAGYIDTQDIVTRNCENLRIYDI